MIIMTLTFQLGNKMVVENGAKLFFGSFFVSMIDVTIIITIIIL